MAHNREELAAGAEGRVQFMGAFLDAAFQRFLGLLVDALVLRLQGGHAVGQREGE